ncbi:MAG TPA: glycosyltransferase [Chitinophagaceae bacterium]|nr:glycosyltransferase [Chitinophagaceae bacterium]
MKPTISVITICFNNLPELIATCLSVDQQSRLPDEHIIVDGSTEKEIINWLTNHPQPPYRRWIHEPDKGISDAFNKGIQKASGEITHLLNSGDGYTDTAAIETMVNRFSEDSSLMWIHSQYIQHRGDMDVISGLPFEKDKLWKGMRTVAHPSMFIKKEVYERHGNYNTDYKIAMDYDMLVRMRDEKNAFITRPLVYFAPGGASNIHFQKGLAEVKKSHERYIGKSLKQELWQIRQRLLHGFMQTGMGKKWFRLKNRGNEKRKNQ